MMLSPLTDTLRPNVTGAWLGISSVAVAFVKSPGGPAGVEPPALLPEVVLPPAPTPVLPGFRGWRLCTLL